MVLSLAQSTPAYHRSDHSAVTPYRLRSTAPLPIPVLALAMPRHERRELPTGIDRGQFVEAHVLPGDRVTRWRWLLPTNRLGPADYDIGPSPAGRPEFATLHSARPAPSLQEPLGKGTGARRAGGESLSRDTCKFRSEIIGGVCEAFPLRPFGGTPPSYGGRLMTVSTRSRRSWGEKPIARSTFLARQRAARVVSFSRHNREGQMLTGRM